MISASIAALVGIFQYLTGTSVMAEAWVDSEMFESIAGRAVGTLENPNMLGEYLILMIPLAEFPEQWGRTEIFNTPPQNL